MSKYRVLQMTNNNIGAVAVGAFLPLGNITRRVQCDGNCGATFGVTTSNADTIVINEPGNYNVTYNGSLVAGAAGDLGIAIVVNGATIYTGTVTATADATANITVPYQIRVRPNCESAAANIPANVQILLSGVAITGGTSNIIVERVY